jgi:hypothetical protein
MTLTAAFGTSTPGLSKNPASMRVTETVPLSRPGRFSKKTARGDTPSSRSRYWPLRPGIAVKVPRSASCANRTDWFLTGALRGSGGLVAANACEETVRAAKRRTARRFIAPVFGTKAQHVTWRVSAVRIGP